MRPVKAVLHLYFGILILTVDEVKRENVNCPNTVAVGEAVLNLPIHHWWEMSWITRAASRFLDFWGTQFWVLSVCNPRVIQNVLSRGWDQRYGQRDFSWKGLSENFPFAKISVKLMSCAVVWLLWNLQWPRQEGETWPGTALCSSRAEVTQGKMERIGRRKGLTPWSDGKAACPAGSKGGDTVLSPWDVPNPVLSGGLCPVALPVEGRTWSCCFSKEFSCFMVSSSLAPSCSFLAPGPIGAPALPETLGAALRVCTWEGSQCVCLSMQCWGAVQWGV